MLDLALHDYLPGKAYHPEKPVRVSSELRFATIDTRIVSDTWRHKHADCTDYPCKVHFLINEPYPKPKDKAERIASVAVCLMRPGPGYGDETTLTNVRRAAARLATLLAFHLTPPLEEAFSLPRTREPTYSPLPFGLMQDLVARSDWHAEVEGTTRHRRHKFTRRFPVSPATLADCLVDLTARLPPVLGNKTSLYARNHSYLTLVDHSADCLSQLTPEEYAAVRHWYDPQQRPPTPTFLPTADTLAQDAALRRMTELAVAPAKRLYSPLPIVECP